MKEQEENQREANRSIEGMKWHCNEAQRNDISGNNFKDALERCTLKGCFEGKSKSIDKIKRESITAMIEKEIEKDWTRNGSKEEIKREWKYNGRYFHESKSML